MPSANDSLTDLYNTLLEAYDALNAKRIASDDDDQRDAIETEMQEVTHRIDLAQGQLFTQDSDSLDTAIGKVDTAKGNFDTALASANTARNIVTLCTSFLKVVDSAIDLAKKLP